MTDIVTVDLDSTLCDTGHRQAMIKPGEPTDWNAYSLACSEDVLVEATRVLVRMLAYTHDIHYLTGRSEVARGVTLDWLINHELPIHGLWMDDTTDAQHVELYGGHAQYKVARVGDIEKATGKKVALHVDDWSSVKVEMERNGIPCLCVRTPQEVLEQASLTSPR
jgi:hypothetical protein